MKRHTPRNNTSAPTRRHLLKSAAAAAACLSIAVSAAWAQAPPKAAAIAPLGIEGQWRVLFDGKGFDGWQNAGGKAPGKGWALEDGAMVRTARAGDIWTKERFGDFVLDLEMKTKGNSGIFIRTDNIRSCVQTGIEVAIDKSFGKTKLGTHDFGAIYDCLAPTKNALTGPDEWQRVVITCNDNRITIEVNGQLVTDMDLNKWTEAGKNPVGKPKNKFRTAYKDMKREGHIGFQDHGAWVAYRKVKIKPLNQTPKKTGGPTCPACGQKGTEGQYCAKCNAVVTELGEYKCTMCGKKVKSGTYSEKSNKFLFNVNDDVRCKCGKAKGTWCATCGQYACLPSVTYCPKCKKPFDRLKYKNACPKCSK